MNSKKTWKKTWTVQDKKAYWTELNYHRRLREAARRKQERKL